eukprot:95373_1
MGNNNSSQPEPVRLHQKSEDLAGVGNLNKIKEYPSIAAGIGDNEWLKFLYSFGKPKFSVKVAPMFNADSNKLPFKAATSESSEQSQTTKDAHTIYLLKLIESKARELVELTVDSFQKGKIKNDQHLVIFLHGYNNTANDVDARIYNIDDRLGTNDIMSIAYNWKSVGTYWDYLTDKQSSLLCAAYFIQYLAEIRKLAQFSKIDIIAHSMGNVLLLESLNIAIKKERIDLFEGIHIISAAADVKFSDYVCTIKKVHLVIGKWTHYYHNWDRALIPSGWFQGYRAGLWPIQSSECPLVQSIQITGVRGLTAHGYIDDSDVQNDIKKAIILNLEPSQRNLRHHSNGDGSCWILQRNKQSKL